MALWLLKEFPKIAIGTNGGDIRIRVLSVEYDDHSGGCNIIYCGTHRRLPLLLR